MGRRENGVAGIVLCHGIKIVNARIVGDEFGGGDTTCCVPLGSPPGDELAVGVEFQFGHQPLALVGLLVAGITHPDTVLALVRGDPMDQYLRPHVHGGTVGGRQEGHPGRVDVPFRARNGHRGTGHAVSAVIQNRSINYITAGQAGSPRRSIRVILERKCGRVYLVEQGGEQSPRTIVRMLHEKLVFLSGIFRQRNIVQPNRMILV